MNNRINSICIEYGDAVFRVFHMSLSDLRGDPSCEHCHQYYELHLCLDGSYDYNLDGKKIPLRRGQLLIFPPEQNHFPVIPTGGYQYAIISFSLSEQKGKKGFYRAFRDTLERQSTLPLSLPPTLIHRICALNEADWSGSLRSFCALKAEVSELLFELLETLGTFSSDDSLVGWDRDREDIHALLDNLLNNQNLSLGEIAGEINYSERHTARLIRQSYGASLSELRKKQKNER